MAFQNGLTGIFLVYPYTHHTHALTHTYCTMYCLFMLQVYIALGAITIKLFPVTYTTFLSYVMFRYFVAHFFLLFFSSLLLFLFFSFSLNIKEMELTNSKVIVPNICECFSQSMCVRERFAYAHSHKRTHEKKRHAKIYYKFFDIISNWNNE